MELTLTPHTTIQALKKQFANRFPFLKLDFFWQPHCRKEGSVPQQKISDGLTLAEIKNFTSGGTYSFRSSITISAFEQHLQNIFGLPVQVFRWSGNIWLETTKIDSFSLEKQNSMGEAASKPVRFNINSLFL